MCMSSFVLSCRSCTTTTAFSTGSAAAPARTGATSPLDLTVIHSEFSLEVLLQIRMGLRWKLARTLTGYNHSPLQRVKGCSAILLAESKEKVRRINPSSFSCVCVHSFSNALALERKLVCSGKSLADGGQDGPRSDGREDAQCNMSSKVTHLAWHPTENFLVCAANNSLYMYHT